MPRRRSNLPNAVANSSLASKRSLSPPPGKQTPSRQSKRLKSSPITNTTPKKSPYFEHPTDDEEEVESKAEKEESGYEDEDASAVSAPTSDDDDDDDNASNSEEYTTSSKPAKKPSTLRGRKPKKPVAAVTTDNNNHIDNPQDLWRPDVKSSLPPGQAIFIPLPRAPPAGKTPYTPSTLHPNTLDFLRDLNTNNDRAWLTHHNAAYRAATADFASFITTLTEHITTHADTTIPDSLPAKDLIFRIYRDVRFSADKTPYKPHFSAAWSRTGKKGPYAGYYFQVKPGGGSFVGGGMWCPEAGPLALLRRDVDSGGGLKRVLGEEGMRREFLSNSTASEVNGKAKGKGKGRGKGDEGNEKKKGNEEVEKECVKKFIAMNAENALKTKPKGYEADNPNIPLLRLRNYTVGRKLKDEEVLGPGAVERVGGLVGVLEPFVTYLNSVVMPDEEPSDGDDDNEDEDEEGEEEDEEEEEE